MKPKSPSYPIILASTSRYRKMLLQRLGLEFSCLAPLMDETPLPDERAIQLTQRLAEGKARSVASIHPRAIVIGCDQVAEFNGTLLGKPSDSEDAVNQLMQFSGHCVEFMSALCVLREQSGFIDSALVTTRVHFREFSEAEARRYIELDQPLDCAGSFKSEAGGSALLRKLESPDPTALIGLPLIALSDILRKAGLQIP